MALVRFGIKYRFKLKDQENENCYKRLYFVENAETSILTNTMLQVSKREIIMFENGRKHN